MAAVDPGLKPGTEVTTPRGHPPPGLGRRRAPCNGVAGDKGEGSEGRSPRASFSVHVGAAFRRDDRVL
jgi:hypothetical protein